MKQENSVRLFSLTLAAAALWMMYLVGGWMLPVAIFLFAWSMNIDNDRKRGA